MRITDFSINKRLWLAIMFPLVAALTLASMELLDSWRSYRQMQTVAKKVYQQLTRRPDGTSAPMNYQRG